MDIRRTLICNQALAKFQFFAFLGFSLIFLGNCDPNNSVLESPEKAFRDYEYASIYCKKPENKVSCDNGLFTLKDKYKDEKEKHYETLLKIFNKDLQSTNYSLSYRKNKKIKSNISRLDPESTDDKFDEVWKNIVEGRRFIDYFNEMLVYYFGDSEFFKEKLRKVFNEKLTELKEKEKAQYLNMSFNEFKNYYGVDRDSTEEGGEKYESRRKEAEGKIIRNWNLPLWDADYHSDSEIYTMSVCLKRFSGTYGNSVLHSCEYTMNFRESNDEYNKIKRGSISKYTGKNKFSNVYIKKAVVKMVYEHSIILEGVELE